MRQEHYKCGKRPYFAGDRRIEWEVCVRMWEQIAKNNPNVAAEAARAQTPTGTIVPTLPTGITQATPARNIATERSAGVDFNKLLLYGVIGVVGYMAIKQIIKKRI
jgi:hypothetical protein